MSDSMMGGIDLSQFDDAFKSAPEPESDDLPTGTFQGVVETLKLDLTKGNNGRPKQPILKWGLRVLAPSHVGRMAFKNNLFATAQNMTYLKKDIGIFGVQLASLSELESRLQEIQGRALEFNVSVKEENGQEYRNIYFKREIELTPELIAARDGIDTSGGGEAKPLPF